MSNPINIHRIQKSRRAKQRNLENLKRIYNIKPKVKISNLYKERLPFNGGFIEPTSSITIPLQDFETYKSQFPTYLINHWFTNKPDSWDKSFYPKLVVTNLQI
ncbi:MAG: hypothetical protein OXE99_03945 [Cellvibrionales bacterium]|nr:hypothetical protein [Cellvibrionales bacterium]